MQHRYAAEAVDRTFRDLTDVRAPFGGVPVVFGGDFRQTLPVVQRGSREQIVQSCLQKSPLWGNTHIFHLSRNMRLEDTPENVLFAQWLIEVGEGKHLDEAGMLTLPPSMKCGDDLESLMKAIYPEIDPQRAVPGGDYFLQRAILSTLNSDVDELNQKMLGKFPGQAKTYMSADKVAGEEQAQGLQAYPTEYLHSINPTGFPSSRVTVKVGVPLMILRNLCPSSGLCNGTRVIVTRMHSRVIEAQILGGEHNGEKVFIPRITLIADGHALPFELHRRQFPVRLAFSMTINKSQGQSLQYVGLDLRTPVFAHGQLYVALSRCTSADRIKVLFPAGAVHTKTKNVVYPEVLLRPPT
jgi:hypothetical protein